MEIPGPAISVPVVSTMSELVSAVIPTRKRPELVVRAVLSALGQSHYRMEVIVVIDGKDRATEERLRRIQDSRLRVIPLAVNVGGSEARNVGAREARGAWVAFLDDDDEWLPLKIAMQLEGAQAAESSYPVVSSRVIVRTPNLDFVGPQHLYVEGKPVSEHLFCRGQFADGAYAMQTSTLFMRREMLLAIPFRAGLKRHQDWDWVLRASQHAGVSFQMLAEPLTVYRVEDERTSVGRAIDWEFSARWGREMRPYFTPKAYSFFLATECISRAVKNHAGIEVYGRLLREFLVEGAPTVRAAVWVLAFVCVPQRLRTLVRNSLRRTKAAHREPDKETHEILTKQTPTVAAFPDTII